MEVSGKILIPDSSIDASLHEFVEPKKDPTLSGPEGIPKWEKSEAYTELIGFLHAMNESVTGKKNSDDYPVSQMIKNLTEMLNKMDCWIDEIPPIEQPQRFGNKAFRDWFSKLQTEAPDLLKSVLDEKFHRAIVEIVAYLVDGFGNSTRIDYGTGHEMTFVAFLCCLFKIGALISSDAEAVVLKVFVRYLEVVRKLQTTYNMEPAGSHGVWSLDDFQFIPFYWGSSQLIDHKRIKPKSFVKPEIFDHFSKDYMFLSSIKFINHMKTGPFAEHSNQLWNISGVPNWNKVNTGLMKMYKAEVLTKFPIIQHFLFGSLLTIQPKLPVP